MAVPSLVYLSAPHYSAFFDVVHSPDAGKVRLVSEGYVNLTFLLQPPSLTGSPTHTGWVLYTLCADVQGSCFL